MAALDPHAIIAVTHGIGTHPRGWSEPMRRRWGIPEHHWLELSYDSILGDDLGFIEADPIKSRYGKPGIVDEGYSRYLLDAVFLDGEYTRPEMLEEVDSALRQVPETANVILWGHSLGSIVNAYVNYMARYSPTRPYRPFKWNLFAFVTAGSPMRAYLRRWFGDIHNIRANFKAPVSKIGWWNFIDPNDAIGTSFSDAVRWPYNPNERVIDIVVENKSWARFVPTRIGEILRAARHHGGYKDNDKVTAHMQLLFKKAMEQ